MSAESVKVTRWRCAHCRRTWAHRAGAEAHIGRCYKNPAARGCKTCGAYQPPERPDYATGYPGCRESCWAGVAFTDGRLNVHCELWEPRP